jgi:hypothetical protein
MLCAQVEELWREALTLSTYLGRAANGSSSGVAPGVLEKLLPKRAKQAAKLLAQQQPAAA